MQKIFFLLPGISDRPIGGYKVVYEYANRLQGKYAVTIVYDCPPRGMRFGIPKFLGRILVRAYSRLVVDRFPTWFKLNNKIKKVLLQDVDLAEADVLVATAYNTAGIVRDAKVLNKLYLIQDFECWGNVTAEQVLASYNYGFKNIVVSKWLQGIVDKAAPKNKSTLIYNGINLDVFIATRPVSTRIEHSVAMLYHTAEYKGSKYGIEAIIKLKQIYPDLQAFLFGTYQRPAELPEWISYKKDASEADLHNIYNSASVYIYPSIDEGFGLTCVESMACGCALCVTDYIGAKDFAIDGETALVSPVKNVTAMVENVERLFENNDLRNRIAQTGHDYVQRFSWDKAIKQFESVISERADGK